MSSSNREAIGFIAEVTFGNTPSTPTGQLIEFTDTTLGQTNETTVSNTIRSDTNRAGTIRTNINPGGDLGLEWQFDAYDSFIEAALRSTFAADVNISATTIDAVAADNSYNDSGSGFGSVIAGQWLKVSGFATEANNGFCRVATQTTAKLVVTGLTLVDESVGPTVVMHGGLMKNGIVLKSYTFERDFQDIVGGQFLSITGLRVTDMNFSFPLTSIATLSFSFLGKVAAQDTSTIWTATTPAVSNPKMNTIDDVKAVYIDNVISTNDFTQIDLAVTTNSEALKKIGALESVDIDQRSIGVTGTLSLYFEDAVFLAKSFTFTPFKFAFITEDSNGDAYAFDMQEVNITGGGPDNPGIDQTIQTPFTYEAVFDADSAATISITRIPAS